jgi:hypothetical protein
MSITISTTPACPAGMLTAKAENRSGSFFVGVLGVAAS